MGKNNLKNNKGKQKKNTMKPQGEPINFRNKLNK